MINVAELTKTIQKVLKEHPTLLDLKNVERGEYVNFDPGACPWLGVYRTDVEYAPRALGNHSKSWEVSITIKLVLQVYGKDGPTAEEELENLIHRVLSVMLTDLTVKQVVQMLRTMRVQYSYDETESKTMDFQWAFVTLVYETRTGV